MAHNLSTYSLVRALVLLTPITTTHTRLHTQETTSQSIVRVLS